MASKPYFNQINTAVNKLYRKRRKAHARRQEIVEHRPSFPGLSVSAAVSMGQHYHGLFFPPVKRMFWVIADDVFRTIMCKLCNDAWNNRTHVNENCEYLIWSPFITCSAVGLSRVLRTALFPMATWKLQHSQLQNLSSFNDETLHVWLRP